VTRAQIAAAGRSVLEATLAWSYDLLDADEQLLFRRLGVFAGQFTLAGAESVVADQDLDAADVLDLLAALVDRSLVVRTDEGGYRQLFVIREAAARLARDAAEFDDLAARHLAWCLALALDRRRPDLDERARFDPLRQVNDELVAALTRELGEEAAGLQTQLAGALEEFWYLRGAFSESRANLELVLARGAGFRSHRAEVHRSVGYLAKSQGDLRSALDHFGRARALFEEIVDELRAQDSPHVPLFEHHLAVTLIQASETARELGEVNVARQLAATGLALPGPAQSRAAMYLGLAEYALGDTAAGNSHIEAALRAAIEQGDELLAGDCHRSLGVLARAEGRLEEAEAHYRRALDVDRRLGGEQVLAHTLLSLAELLEFRGLPAGEVLEEGLELARALGDRRAEAHGLATLAELTAATDPVASAALHEQVLALRLTVGVPAEIALSQLRVAAFAEFAGHFEDAITLTERALVTFRGLRDDRSVVESLAQLARLRIRAGLPDADTALDEARARDARGATPLDHADVLETAAWAAAAQGQREESRGLLAEATAHRLRMGLRPSEPTRRLTEALRAEVAAAV
jgi:tetratricopeptide (TPR) repeat protein